MAKQKNVAVIPAEWKLSEDKQDVELGAEFKKQVLSVASEIGGTLTLMSRTAEERAAVCISLTQVFTLWKDKNPKGGLTQFVHDKLDATCPAAYGKVGTEERRKVTTHKVFSGIEYMVKKGKKALEKINEVKVLRAAGIEPTDEPKVKEHQSAVRDAERRAFQSAFNKMVLDFHKFGVTETTISNVLKGFVLRRRKTDEGGAEALNAAQQKIVNAALATVLAAQGIAVKETAKAVVSQVDVMEQLKASVGASKKRK